MTKTRNKVFLHVSEESRRWANELDHRLNNWSKALNPDSIYCPSGKYLMSMNQKQFSAFIKNKAISREHLSELKNELREAKSKIDVLLRDISHNTRFRISYIESTEYEFLKKYKENVTIKYEFVNSEFGRRNAEKDASLSSAFITAAYKILTKEQTNAVWDLAHELTEYKYSDRNE